MRLESPELSDEELARQTQAGSLVAFEELVYRYEARLYRFVFARTGHDTDARDLTQTAFVAAYRGISRFNPQRRFAPWLFSITRHAMIDHFRATPVATDEPLPTLLDPRDPSVVLAERETHSAIWQLARRTLTNDQFAALWLKYEEDLPVKDIARAMRKTGLHVKVLLHRARQKLLRELNADRAFVVSHGVGGVAFRSPTALRPETTRGCVPDYKP